MKSQFLSAEQARKLVMTGIHDPQVNAALTDIETAITRLAKQHSLFIPSLNDIHSYRDLTEVQKATVLETLQELGYTLGVINGFQRVSW